MCEMCTWESVVAASALGFYCRPLREKYSNISPNCGARAPLCGSLCSVLNVTVFFVPKPDGTVCPA